MFKPRLLPTIAASLCGLILTASELRAQSFRRALPPGTIFYSNLPDIGATMSQAKGSPIAEMWKEEQVQDFLGEAISQLRAQIAQYRAMGEQMHEEGQLPFDPATLEQLRIDQAGFALTSFRITTYEGKPWPDLGLAWYFDFGDSAPHWRQLLAIGFDMVGGQLGEKVTMTRSELEAGGEMVSFRPAVEAYPMSLHLVFEGNGLLIGTSEAQVQGILARMRGGAEATGTTTASGDFRDVLGHLDAQGAEFEGVVQLGPILDAVLEIVRTVQQEADEPAIQNIDVAAIDKALTATGLRSMKSLGTVSRYTDDGTSVGEMFMLCPEPLRRGITAAPTTLDTSFLSWIPRDAVSFSASSFDATATYDGLVAGLKAYDPELAEQALSMLAQLEQNAGASLRNDLFASLGNRVVRWQMPTLAFGGAPELGIVLEVKDKDRLVRSLETMSAMTNGLVTLEPIDRRGVKGWKIRLDVDTLSDMIPRGGSEMSMAMGMLEQYLPRFTFEGNNLVAAMTIGDVKRALQRIERTADSDPEEDIRTSPEFVPHAARLAAMDGVRFSAMKYTDWKTTFETTYQALVGFLPFFTIPAEVPIDVSLLPEADVLTKHLSGSFSWSTVDASGFRTQSVSPFGVETWLPLVTLLGVGAVAGLSANVIDDDEIDISFR